MERYWQFEKFPKLKTIIMKTKIFNKILKLFFINKKIEIFLFLKKKKNIIFDKTGSKEFQNLFEDKDVFILKTRPEHLKKIYFSKKIFFSILKNLFNFKLKQNYLIAVINEISPEIVIKIIDNSPEFWKIANHFRGKIKFIGVQNSTRGDWVELPNIWGEEVCFTNYVCFSEFDIQTIKSIKNIKVKKFFIGGSIRNSNFYNKIKKNPNKNIAENYDICFISKQDLSEAEAEKNRRVELIDLLQKTAKYSKKFNKKVIIASKRDQNKKEEDFYNKIFSGSLFKINWRTDSLKSYEAINNSELIIGLSSTILREAYSYKSKILCCGSKRNKYWDPFWDFNYLSDFSYDNLEKKLNLLFKINLDEYYKKLDKKKDYYMSEVDTNNFLKNLIINKSQLF